MTHKEKADNWLIAMILVVLLEWGFVPDMLDCVGFIALVLVAGCCVMMVYHLHKNHLEHVK